MLSVVSWTLGAGISLNNTSEMWNSSQQNKFLADAGLKTMAQTAPPAVVFNPITKLGEMRNGDVVCIQSVHSKLSLWADTNGDPGVFQKNICEQNNFFRLKEEKFFPGHFRFCHIDGSGCLSVGSYYKGRTGVVIEQEDMTNDDQLWKFDFMDKADKARGYVHVVHVETNSDLDVWGHSTLTKKRIVTWHGRTANDNQKWIVNLVSLPEHRNRTLAMSQRRRRSKGRSSRRPNNKRSGGKKKTGGKKRPAPRRRKKLAMRGKGKKQRRRIRHLAVKKRRRSNAQSVNRRHKNKKRPKRRARSSSKKRRRGRE